MSVCSLRADTLVTGVVSDAGGKPVVGTLIKVINADRGLGYMVVSKEQGKFATPNLPPGMYTAKAFGGVMQSETLSPVHVTDGHVSELKLTLSAPRKIAAPVKRLSNADYAKLMPEGEGKRLIMTRCTLCHGVERIVRRRAKREEWEKTIDQMLYYLKANKVPVSNQERNTILDYVVKNSGPDIPPMRLETDSPDPNGHLPATLLDGIEANYIAMEFNVEGHPELHDIAPDANGIVWVCERYTGRLGHFDSKSLTYTRITPPGGKYSERALGGCTFDPEGKLWFTDGRPNGILIQFDTKTNEFLKFEIPRYANITAPSVEALAFLNGSVWGTGISMSRIVRLDLKTREFADYPLAAGSHPYGMAIGGDRMLWFVSQWTNQIMKLDPANAQFTGFKIPTAASDARGMQVDAEGNLWVGGFEAGKLVKAEYQSGRITEYAPPTPASGPYWVDVDRKHNLIWFSEYYSGKLGRYDPKANSFVEFALPSVDLSPGFSDAKVIWIHVDPVNPNRVWWGGGTASKIGYIEVIDTSK